MNIQASEEDDIRELYRELILDHARSPRHFGRLKNPTHSAQGINPLCGDKLTLYLDVDSENIIRAAGFEGSGCAISVASASLLTETVKGVPVDRAEAMLSAVTGRLTSAGTDREITGDIVLDKPLAKLHALDGVREYPSRVKCATLAWRALHSALANDTTPATTE